MNRKRFVTALVIVVLIVLSFLISHLLYTNAATSDIDVSDWSQTSILGVGVSPSLQGMCPFAIVRSLKDNTVSIVNIEGVPVEEDVKDLVGSTLYVYPNTKAGDSKKDSMIIKSSKKSGWFW